MDRTRRLLMSITASALVAGGGGTNPSLLEVRAAATDSETIEPESPYYNPQADSAKIAEASKIISSLLAGVQAEHAMTLNELLEKRPDLNRGISERAIQELLNQGTIRKTGDGTQGKPFRYYDRSHSGSGGGHGG